MEFKDFNNVKTYKHRYQASKPIEKTQHYLKFKDEQKHEIEVDYWFTNLLFYLY